VSLSLTPISHDIDIATAFVELEKEVLSVSYSLCRVLKFQILKKLLSAIQMFYKGPNQPTFADCTRRSSEFCLSARNTDAYNTFVSLMFDDKKYGATYNHLYAKKISFCALFTFRLDAQVVEYSPLFTKSSFVLIVFDDSRKYLLNSFNYLLTYVAAPFDLEKFNCMYSKIICVVKPVLLASPNKSSRRFKYALMSHYS
jgi:hypothetical protein